jgi:hypothetical protein
MHLGPHGSSYLLYKVKGFVLKSFERSNTTSDCNYVAISFIRYPLEKLIKLVFVFEVVFVLFDFVFVELEIFVLLVFVVFVELDVFVIFFFFASSTC